MRGFPSGRRTRSVLVVVATVLVAGAVVGSVTLDERGRGDGDGDESASALATRGPDAAYDTDTAYAYDTGAARETGGGGPVGAVGTGGTAAGAPPSPLLALDTQRVVKTGTLEIEVGEQQFETVQDRALRQVEDAGGFVQASNLTPVRASLTFRVPAERFEPLLRRLRDLGTVKDETVNGQDVSEEYVDLEARLRHWRAQEAVFLDLLGRARNVAETVEIRRELSTIQQTVEQLQSRIRFLDDRTGFSTLTLELFVPGGAARSGEDGPSLSRAWGTARDAAVHVVGGTLIVLGVVVPLGAISVLVGGAAWLALRRRRPGPVGVAS